jgi:membrane-bound lytic murein transglycosylase A
MPRCYVLTLISAAGALMLGACAADRVPSAQPMSAPKPTNAPLNAVAAGVSAGVGLDLYSVSNEALGRALAAFRVSCPSVMKRSDASGLTQAGDWDAACEAAGSASDARQFFSENFASIQIGDGRTLATGYYEPEIAGSRSPGPGFTVPIYRRPADLVEADLGLFATDLQGRRVRGRLEGGRFIPYADRAAIEAGSLAGRGLELAWAADPIELFFLEVQGSGRLRLPDGSIMRIGYDGQNGHAYTSIGKVMRDRGLLSPDKASMQGIMAWLRANPAEGRAIMQENKSYVFFRELTGAGPLGALGLPVTPRATVAADPRFVPLGAPVLLATDRGEANGLWVAQDTGGAIKGANRFDTFWGAGERAREISGGMMARGMAHLLLPKRSVARLMSGADHANAPAQR